MNVHHDPTTFDVRHRCGHVAKRWRDVEKRLDSCIAYWEGQLCTACWKQERAKRRTAHTVREDGRELSRWPTLKAALAEADRIRAGMPNPAGHITVIDVDLDEEGR